ncbi:MAG: isopeptide-forming domain-containing fimbrial protein [Lachnospiraceae bacterium]|nr:isopeptide-forming domain-containing fimbrial protein [Lachnospiraceae bacterium]
MKKMRRIVSFMLAAMMVMAMAITAGAATITIENTQDPPLKYEAYQVIKGDVVTENGKTTFANVAWGDGVNVAAFLPELNKIAGFDAVTDAETFVEALAKEQNDTKTMQQVAAAVAKALGTVAGTSTQQASPYTIDVKESGYYFVQDVSGLAVAANRDSKYALVVVDQAAKIAIKTDVPTQEKKVVENQTTNYLATETERQTWGTGYNDVADYNINDVVPFEIISTVPNFNGMKSYYYEFVDQMDRAFTLDEDSIEVAIRDKNDIEKVKRVLVKGTDYTVMRAATTTYDQFNVIINDLVTTLKPEEIGEKIVVRFNATLNENAIIGRPGNRNKSKLRYGNNPNVQGEPTKETPWDEVVVFTYELDAEKTDSEDAQLKLKDAEFVFYRPGANNTKEYVVVDANSKVQKWIAIPDAPAGTADLTAYYRNAGASILTSDANGLFGVIGLDEGVYYLKETKAPTGYNLMKKEVKVEIIANTNNGHNGANNALISTMRSIDDGAPAHAPIPGSQPAGFEGVEIENNKGVELPETGGIGTTIFYVIGAALMIGAGVVLVTRRRMAK